MKRGAGEARFRDQVGADREGRPLDMRGLNEITLDGDIIGDDGDVYSLFTYDPESLGDEPLD